MKISRKILYLSMLSGLMIFPFMAFPQGAAFNVSGAAADPSSMLDVSATNKGVLVPRVALTDTLDAITVTSPATSLLIYNTTVLNGLVAGYYYNAGTPSAPHWAQLIPNPVNTALNMNGHKVVNVATCTNNPDAANKAYVDAQIALVGGSSPNCCQPSMISDESTSTMNLRSACDYCRNLTEGGYTDWRLPTFHELLYVMSSTQNPIPNDQSANFIWMADYDTQYGLYIYQIKLSDGEMTRTYAYNSARVRCVR